MRRGRVGDVREDQTCAAVFACGHMPWPWPSLYASYGSLLHYSPAPLPLAHRPRWRPRPNPQPTRSRPTSRAALPLTRTCGRQCRAPSAAPCCCTTALWRSPAAPALRSSPARRRCVRACLFAACAPVGVVLPLAPPPPRVHFVCWCCVAACACMWACWTSGVLDGRPVQAAHQRAQGAHAATRSPPFCHATYVRRSQPTNAASVACSCR